MENNILKGEKSCAHIKLMSFSCKIFERKLHKKSTELCGRQVQIVERNFTFVPGQD